MAKNPVQDKKQGVMESEVKHPEGGVEKQEEVISEVVYDQPTCNVGLSMGGTINVGNYNSVKVHVSLHVPCYPQEVDTVFDIVKAKVDEKLGALYKEIHEAYGLTK